jgi:hypothetical protein
MTYSGPKRSTPPRYKTQMDTEEVFFINLFLKSKNTYKKLCFETTYLGEKAKGSPKWLHLQVLIE